MTKIQGSAQVNKPQLGDVTGPPTPQVRQAICFDHAKDDATVFNNAGTVRPGGRDPAYFEFGNVEIGTKIQMINISKDPDVTFGEKKKVVELDFTGRDVHNRQAAIYLTNEQMTQLELKPGDMLQMRALDQTGNTSDAVTVEVEPNDWAGQTVRERVDNRNVDARGGRINALDGEAERKNLIIKAVNDTRPPQLLGDRLELQLDDRFSDKDKELAQTLRKHWSAIKTTLGKDQFTMDELKSLVTNDDLAEELRAAAKVLSKSQAAFDRFDVARQNNPDQTDGTITLQDIDTVRAFRRSVTLVGDKALEPRSQLRVQNQRTGETFNASVGDDRQLNINLKDVRDGDPLLLTPTDNEGVQGQTMELVFAARGKGGKAPNLKGGIATRLPGVI